MQQFLSGRLVYDVAMSTRLIRTDYGPRLSVLGNEGRRIAEYFCLPVCGHLSDPEVLQSEPLFSWTNGSPTCMGYAKPLKSYR